MNSKHSHSHVTSRSGLSKEGLNFHLQFDANRWDQEYNGYSASETLKALEWAKGHRVAGRAAVNVDMTILTWCNRKR